MIHSNYGNRDEGFTLTFTCSGNKESATVTATFVK